MFEHGIGDVLAAIPLRQGRRQQFILGFELDGQVVNERPIILVDRRPFDIDVQAVKAVIRDVRREPLREFGSFGF